MPIQEAKPDQREWLIVGCVRKPHGVHGDLLVEILTDFPERLQEGVRFGLGDETGPDAYHVVHAVRYHRGGWLLSVRDLRDRDVAEGWRGRYLFLPEQRPEELPEGYHYDHQFVGLRCRSPEGEDLGEVVALDGEGLQARLVVRRGGRDFLVPYVPQLVTEVDVEAGTATIDAPPGLLDDDFVEA